VVDEDSMSPYLHASLLQHLDEAIVGIVSRERTTPHPHADV